MFHVFSIALDFGLNQGISIILDLKPNKGSHKSIVLYTYIYILYRHICIEKYKDFI